MIANKPAVLPEPASPLPLVLHLVYRFDTGGLENGVVNLINRGQRYRHMVVALTEVSETFSRRVSREGVRFVSLHKPPGHGLRIYGALLQLLREVRPDIVHTRNLAALECQLPVWMAGVPVRIHGEHGRDADDPDGLRKRYQWIRRVYSPFVQQYVALSADLEGYLRQRVGIRESRITRICNGVDLSRFQLPEGAAAQVPGHPFTAAGLFVVGTVGRMQTVKAQPLLAQAFVQALAMAPHLRERLRLVMVGDGALRAVAQAVLDDAKVAHLAWLPGERQDVPQVMHSLDCFALPSLAEGISNTILEAMASGLPVVATDVGGNAELVVNGETGMLVPAGDVDALARALVHMAENPEHAAGMGLAGRQRAAAAFSLPAMVTAYEDLYARLLNQRSRRSTLD